jgi:hypothetical protein
MFTRQTNIQNLKTSNHDNEKITRKGGAGLQRENRFGERKIQRECDFI